MHALAFHARRISQLLTGLFLLALLGGVAHARDPGQPFTGSAAELRAKHAELRDQLASNPFRSPLHLVSSESSDRVSGSIYAVIRQPFAAASAALVQPAAWCDILILHMNTKYCRASGAQNAVLDVAIGKKQDQAVADAFRVAFTFRVPAASSDYLKVALNADAGPLGTRDYRIAFEATPLDADRTFIHLDYSYAYGVAGRLAMGAYLGTTGREKVGFTVIGTLADGRPKLIGGMRGVAERNTMRYYLAIESHLGALSSPPQARIEKSLRDWFAATERYPRQLHELREAEYLDMKRREYLRQS
jgi:hypothetical protein